MAEFKSDQRTGEHKAKVLSLDPAAADALLLFGLNRPVYPADRPTYRIMSRHGWINATADYEEARANIEGPADGDVVILANLASWLGRVGELHCRAKVADCKRCPLEPLLPANGPIDPIAE